MKISELIPMTKRKILDDRLSFKEAGEIIGIPYQKLVKVLNGSDMVDLEIIDKLAVYCGVKLVEYDI